MAVACMWRGLHCWLLSEEFEHTEHMHSIHQRKGTRQSTSSCCSAILGELYKNGKSFTENVQILLLDKSVARESNVSQPPIKVSRVCFARGHSKKLGFVFSVYLK